MKRQHPRGMTLIEIMIVLVIVGGLLAVGVGLFSSLSKANLKGQALRLSGYVKYTYGQAAIQQKYYRMVIDVNTNEYWIEVSEKKDDHLMTGGGAGSGSVAIGDVDGLAAPPPGLSATSRPSKARGKNGYEEGDSEGGVFGLTRTRNFSAAQERLAKRRELQSGIRFASVTTSYDEGPITQGRAYINFYPNGFVDRSQIVISDKDDAKMTLELQPLTGKVDLFLGEQEAGRDFFEVEEDE